MADSDEAAVQLDLGLVTGNKDESVEDKNSKIKVLTEELREELILSNSLTQIIAEKSSEIEHLQNKIGEQESRVHNLEDQIEEWTTQAEACDKVLEQKDCEIEMLKKTLNIEKQQRRDLEEMMMEVGKETIKDREVLDMKIEELQNQMAKMEEERKNANKVIKNIEVSETTEKDVNVHEEKMMDNSGDKNTDQENCDSKDESGLNEEYKADMEVLMNDLFVLIKQNEELKEENEKLKREQVSLLEDKRSVVMELETAIEEKAAEIQHQKHEMRRLSSAVEVGVVASDIEKYNQVKQIREELDGKIHHLESTNIELKESLDECIAAKEAMSKQYMKVKKKLQMEREQNAELNKQILEVSNLYDTYYSRCEELEKGRIKGLSVPLGGSLVSNIESIDKAVREEVMGVQSVEHSAGEPKRNEPSSVLAKSPGDMNDEVAVETQKTSSSDDKKFSDGQEKAKKKNSSKKKRSKLKKQVSSEKDTKNNTPRLSEFLLNVGVSLFKVLLLITTTFVVITALRVHYELSFEKILSGVFASYVFVYNIWRIFSSRKKTEGDHVSSKYVESMEGKLRSAMQDLIMRLDDDNFKQFSEIYENYITETFARASQVSDLKEEVKYLAAAKNILANELDRYKERNRVVNADYERMKMDIERLKIRRTNEGQEKENVIRSLREDISSLEIQLKKDLKMEENAGNIPKSHSSFHLKLLIFAILEGCFVISVGNSYLLIPVSALSVLLLALIYRSDLQLGRAFNEVQCCRKTVEELLRKVDEYRKEGKQISNEVKELEIVVDKDYEIISKQRIAIERLEKQLNRAINKYTEKKRALGKVMWLQENGIGNYYGLNSSSCGEETTGESAIDFSDSFTKLSKTNVERKSPLAHAKGKNLVSICNKISATCLFVVICSVGSVYSKGETTAFGSYSKILGTFAGLGSVFILWKLLSKGFSVFQSSETKAKIKEFREDETMLCEKIEALRQLLASEREFAAKLEKQIEGLTESTSVRSIPKDEVNAVIDRLIEVSKQRDELEVEATNTKDKYDHVKRTLEDILSREKYLSEEVSLLRTQKRELQSDLMKEQIKHIDMYVEIKRLKEDSEKEMKCSDVDRPGSNDAWDIDYVDEVLVSVNNVEGVPKVPEVESLIESDGLLDALEKAGIQAQKGRGKRRGNKLLKKEKKSDVHGGTGDSKGKQYNGKSVLDFPVKEVTTSVSANEGKVKEDEKGNSEGRMVDELSKASDNILISSNENIDSFTNVTEVENAGVNTDVNAGVNGDAKAEVNTDASTDANADATADVNADVIVDVNDALKSIDSEESNKVILVKKLSRQEELLKAKESELKQLRELLDVNNYNRSEKPEELDEYYHFKTELSLEKANLAEIEEMMHTLANEIFQLKDVCDSEMNLAKVKESSTLPYIGFLIENIALFRYKISAEKAVKISEIHTLQGTLEEMQKQMEKLHVDIEKERKARNHAIMEYENEYERLENRLSDAYEDIRKRLMEERALRGEIMKQYETEIEDIQSKTTKILQDLHVQLKQERREKEDADYQIGILATKIKELEFELRISEGNGNTGNLQSLLHHQEFADQNDVEKLRQFAEEETNKRTRVLKEKLDQSTRSLEDCKSKLAVKENIIVRLEKQELAYKAKISILDIRMKDLENEVRNGGTTGEEHFDPTGLNDSKDGIIYKLATKNGSSEWKNPASVGIVQVSRSSAGFGSASDILDLKPLPCSTENLENSWFKLDFGHDVTVIPESYSLRHGWLTSDASLRSWVFEGSVEGNQWHTLRKHLMDTSLNDRYMVAAWQLSENYRPFRYLRIRMTGPNASDTNELYLGGLEVFGKIVHAA